MEVYEMKSDDEKKREHFRNAMSNYLGVMNIIHRMEDEGIHHDDNAPVPEGWEDEPLLLLGEYLEQLNLTESEKKYYGKIHLKIVQEDGVEDTWKYRRRYAAEIEFVRFF